MDRVTERQAQAERFIREYHDTRGYAPSFRDVASWLGISINAALGHLTALRKKGRVDWAPGIRRSLRVVNKR